MTQQPSQAKRVLLVLQDGRPHTIEEIHERAGTMRLNSRVAELRGHGHNIVCSRAAGTYLYQLLPSLVDRGEGATTPEATAEPGGTGHAHTVASATPLSLSTSEASVSGSGPQRAPTGTDGEGSRDAGHLSLGVPDPVFPLPGQLRLEVAA